MLRVLPKNDARLVPGAHSRFVRMTAFRIRMAL